MAMNTTQKNSSVIMAGFSGLIVLSNFVARIVLNNIPYENVENMWYWLDWNAPQVQFLCAGVTAVQLGLLL